MLFLYLFFGFVAATFVISWQCFKDPPWEGFYFLRFIRSYIIAAVSSLVLYYLFYLGLIREQNNGVIILSIICIERGLGEVFKVSKKHHEEYKDVFGHYGIRIDMNEMRFLRGLIVFVLIGTAYGICVWLMHLIVMYVPSKLFQGVSLGILTGTLTAFGGAFKDVAYEKFELSKFVRSPIMAALGGLIIVHFATSSDLLVFASFGFERIIVECYKTFIRRKKRGIFEGQKPNHLFWMNARPVFIGTYVLAFAALVYNFLI